MTSLVMGRRSADTSRPRVLVYHHSNVLSYATLLKKFAPDLEIIACQTEEEVDKCIDQADFLFVSTRFPAKMLKRTSRVKFIQVMGAGVEIFAEEGIPPTVKLARVNVGFGEKIAEYVLAYMLWFTQRIGEVLENQRQKRWKPLDLSWLRGEVLGVAGVGAIGTEVAKRARSFEMQVVGFDLTPRKIPEIARWYTWDQLLEFVTSPKFVVICLPLTPKTRGLFNHEVFSRMRQDAVVINVARGPIIREADLIDALISHRIAGAVLDVFEQEPLPEHSPLWTLPNVLITPHHAGPSLPQEMVEFFLENLQRFQKGQPLRGEVDLTRGF